MKKYLLFVSHSYAYSILRPLQDEIRKQGHSVAWYIEDTSPIFLKDNEIRLQTIAEVMQYDPYAIFAPGNHIYDFFPGIKVEVFHGLYYKRKDFGDHYRIRGFFDIYCTTSPLFTPTFEELSQKYGFFKVYETGWSKFDSYDTSVNLKADNGLPTIVYAPTFSKGMSSADDLYVQIKSLLSTKKWNWIFSFHPKMRHETIDKYRQLTEQYNNARFSNTEDKQPIYQEADLMLSDSSSVIYEFMWFNKPVVTYRNTFADNHLIDIQDAQELQQAIEKGLSRPTELMRHIDLFMKKLHPFSDRKASERILEAVDEFNTKFRGKIKKKPLNLLRNLKLRKKVGYFPFGKRIKIRSKAVE